MAKKTVREKLLEVKPATHLPWERGLSSGNTLINLGCTARPDVAFLPGNYVLWVGDSGSGKSFITLTTLAEAALNPAYKDYKLLFNNAENGALFDLERFLPPLVGRLEPLAGTRKEPHNVTVLEEFYDCVDAALKEGPCVILNDSMDALVPRTWAKKLAADKKARAKGEESGGSYGTDKAKINSERLRPVVNRLEASGSILIMISQTRNRIGFGSQFDPKTRGGGDAMRFYAHVELWTSVLGHIYKEFPALKKRVEQGITCRVKIKKNRINGRVRVVDVPILHSHGIDDLGGLVEYLCGWKHWESTDRTVAAPEFDFKGSKEKLIQMLEADGQEEDLRALATKVWSGIEQQCEVRRKPRYGAAEVEE